ncbi:hypothetical protein ES708_31789 [subsurface metagenome]
MATTKKKKRPETKELIELKRAIKGLQALQHNPVQWAALVKFIAPFVARIAARYAARYVATKLGKRLNIKVSGEVAEATADRITDLLAGL